MRWDRCSYNKLLTVRNRHGHTVDTLTAPCTRREILEGRPGALAVTVDICEDEAKEGTDCEQYDDQVGVGCRDRLFVGVVWAEVRHFRVLELVSQTVRRESDCGRTRSEARPAVGACTEELVVEHSSGGGVFVGMVLFW